MLGISSLPSGLTAESVIESLRDGNPSIVVGEEGDTVVFNPNTLLEGDAEVVAERLAGIIG